jgi:predicted ribosome quality control (RQC) complex YloA/Tae2 family protein
MLVKLFLKKTVDQNAALYFEEAKKARQKQEGARETIEKAKKKLLTVKKSVPVAVAQRKREWYEKFRWFHSSEGFLVIGGRDATTNDIVVKKNMDDHDLVFHTSMAGSPFFIVKSDGKNIGEATIEETAQATASYSRAWKLGFASADVFYCLPSQVTKTSESGEFLPRGSFMIRGKTTTLHPRLELAVGVKEGQIIGGPVNAITDNSEKHVLIRQGKTKASDMAKKIRKILGAGDMDEIIRFLPSTGEVVFSRS